MSHADELPILTDSQLEVMNIIWEQSRCSVSDVWRVLNERRGLARNTVHTLISRLEGKGWLQRQEDDGALVYSATVTRESNQRQTVRRLVETVFDGSAEGLVLTLMNEKSISAKEATRIKALIAQARGRKS